MQVQGGIKKKCLNMGVQRGGKIIMKLLNQISGMELQSSLSFEVK